MDLHEIKELHDKAFEANQSTREKASDDLVFYWVTQWDDQLLSDSQLQYRGEFNILRKAGRQIMADLRLNPVQPDFKPKDESREDDAELLDGMYRADDRKLTSQEAYDYGTQDAVVCGYGAWELYTDYATSRAGDEHQVIRRNYLPEANNTVFFDPNAKRLDKSDARYVSILKAYSRDGYEELLEEMGVSEDDATLSSFSQPEQSYAFPWFGGKSETYYVATFYRRVKVKDKVITFTDPFGEPLKLRESDVEDTMDDLIDGGYSIESEKSIERWEVRKYIVSGDRILNGDDGEVVPGEHLPVVPVYGERAIIEGQEHYEGITRLAKDPQRLRNFQMSYLADIVSRSPRPKPIFTPEQLAGFEFMYEESGADNNYPYLLQNLFDGNGQQLPIGPVSQMPDQPVPQALAASLELTKDAIEDVAGSGLPQDVADPDLSGKAVLAIQNRMDQQSYIYQHNFKFAKRRDAEIYASIASEVYDTPRTVMIETPDGTTKREQMMRLVMDKETGETKVLNDLTNLEFDVFAEIGQSYGTQKEQTRERLVEMMGALPDGDPVKDLLMLKALELSDGVAMDDVREFARKRMILAGYKEPESEEEMQMMQEAQQSQDEPNAEMVLAQAEQMKAQADLMREQREQQEGAAEAQVSQQKNQISMYDAMTKRAKVETDAKKAGYDMKKTLAEAENIEFEVIRKQMEAMSDSDLMSVAMGER